LRSNLWLTPEDVLENREEYITVSYYVQCENLSLAEAAERIAIEGSTGTWIRVKHETDELREKYTAKPFRIRAYKNMNIGEVDIAYPIVICDPEIGGIPALLNAIAGTVFALRYLQAIKILDVTFPKSFINAYPGPKFGIEGLKKILGLKKRPPISTAVKPNIGLDTNTFAKVCYEAALGGIDMVLDDEILVNPRNCLLEKRIPKVVSALMKAERETGERKIYGVNITTRADKVKLLAKKAMSLGAEMLAINVITAGFCSVLSIVDGVPDSVPIRGYRHMHAAFTRYPYHGIDMRVLLKLCRMVGVDAIDTGVFGRLADDIVKTQEYNRMLKHKFYGLKAVYPVCSGGIHPGNVEANLRLFGLDTIIHASGAVFGHPKGILIGAKAIRSAVEAVIDGLSIVDAMKKYPEIASSLRIKGWDYQPIPEHLKPLCEF